MLFETDMTTKQVLELYGIWFTFVLILLVILFKVRRH
jgi:hypothetical protein